MKKQEIEERYGKNFNGVEQLKERPRCRKEILKICEESGLILEDLWYVKWSHFSDGMQKQLKKMLWEKYTTIER